MDFSQDNSLKTMKRLSIRNNLIVILVLINTNIYGQLSEGGVPLSFRINTLSKQLEEINIQEPDLEKIFYEDKLNDDLGLPYRVAVHIPAKFDYKGFNGWEELEDGSILSRIKINAKGALGLGIYFERFCLDDGDKLFVYSCDKESLIGAFTKQNNLQDSLFSTQYLYGDCVVVELHRTINLNKNLPFIISEVAYFYRGIATDFDKWGESGDCHVNINCFEGDKWQANKRGIVHINFRTSSGVYICSGSLVNNTSEDKKPYILFAEHCGGSDGIQHSQWVFYFNYERPGCTNVGTSTLKTMTGCNVKAKGPISGGSDFFLVELSQSIPESYEPYWNGWDTRSDAPTEGVSIHHPSGDSKKVSTFIIPTLTTTWNFNVGASNAAWSVRWAPTANGYGVTEGGSSGSPLFNQFGRIVGTLTGGSSSCQNTTNRDFFGKMSYHWESNGSTNDKKLKPWLDPLNTGKLFIEGRDFNNPSTSYVLYDNTYIESVNYSIVSSEFGGLPEGQRHAILADDFSVPAGQVWSISRITTRGEVLPGSAQSPNSFGVMIFENNQGIPGTLLHEYRDIKVHNPRLPDIKLPTPLSLNEGTYWISVFGIFEANSNLAQGHWKWFLGNLNVGNQANHLDQTNLMGGHSWTNLQDLGSPYRSAYFAFFTGPVIYSLTNEIDFGTVTVGSSSVVSNYSINGYNLNSSVKVTAPAGFQISLSPSGGFTSTITVTPQSGTLNQTIYVRFNPTEGGSFIGDIKHIVNNGETSPAYLTLKGTGSQPVITLSKEAIPFGQVAIGSFAIDSYIVNGQFLGGNINISAPSRYQVSTTEDSNFSSALSLSPSNGTISNTQIFVKYTPITLGSNVGNIQHTSSGATTKSLMLTGQGVNPSSIDNVDESNNFPFLYPNPAQNRLYVDFKSEHIQHSVIIYNILGKRVFYDLFISSNDILEIDLSYLLDGVYIVKVLNDEWIRSYRIIIDR